MLLLAPECFWAPVAQDESSFAGRLLFTRLRRAPAPLSSSTTALCSVHSAFGECFLCFGTAVCRLLL